MKIPAISRADLLEAMAAAGTGRTVPVSLLGFELKPAVSPPPEEMKHEYEIEEREDDSGAEGAVKVELKPIHGQRTLSFFVPTSSETFHDQPRVATVLPLPDARLAPPKYQPATYRPLVSWSRLAPFLRRRLGKIVSGRRVDQARLSRMFATGLPLLNLPRLPRQSWGHGACILWDTSLEMEPFQPDAEMLLRRLKRERGRFGLRIIHSLGPLRRPPNLPPDMPVIALSAMGRLCNDGEIQAGWERLGAALFHRGHRLTSLAPCPEQLLITDCSKHWPTAVWDRGTRLSRHIRQPFPFSPPRHRTLSPTVTADGELLLDLLAPATLVTPDLLREVRLLIGPSADAGTEYEAWAHPGGTGAFSARYFSFMPGEGFDARLRRRLSLACEPRTSQLVGSANEAICRHHERYCDLTIALEARLRTVLTGDTEHDLVPQLLLLEQVVERMRELADAPGSRVGYDIGLPTWFLNFVEERLSPELRAHGAVRELLAQGYALARMFLGRLEDLLPNGVDHQSALLELRQHSLRGPQQAESHFEVGVAAGEGLVVQPRGKGKLLAPMAISARRTIFHVTLPFGTMPQPIGMDEPPLKKLLCSPQVLSDLRLETDRNKMVFQAMQRPIWASKMWYSREGVFAAVRVEGKEFVFGWSLVEKEGGTSFPGAAGQKMGRWLLLGEPPVWAEVFGIDSYGLSAEFRVKNVPFVLRWIPPGRFVMGSPEDEPGRFDPEGPQHERVIDKGFWLGETVVTQAQWLAVMGKNPSEFKGQETLPVEQVSWKDCGDYCKKLNSLLPGLRLRLPAEAEWEYACRAGTDTALWTGGITIRGENDAPELDGIAWYGGNSGQDLAVTNPYDAKDWPKRQYPDKEAGTHVVKDKKVNPWGLYDMLGNVWKWCEDVWDAEAYEKFGRGEGLPKVADDSQRVVRGGSWYSHAGYCRAACRFGLEPGDRRGGLGFRLAAGQEQGAAGAAGRGSDPDG